MRRAYQDYGFIFNENGEFIGISLGYDRIAQHECGVGRLRTHCRVPDLSKETMGIMCRTIKKSPLLVFDEGVIGRIPHAILYSGEIFQSLDEMRKYIPRDLKNYIADIKWVIKYEKKHPSNSPKDKMICAWSEDSFGIAVMGKKEVGYLKEIHNAFNKLNISIVEINLMSDSPFSNSSLCFFISDRIPKDKLDGIYHDDKTVVDLWEYEEKIGMTKLIQTEGKKNGYMGHKYFMTCTPKWIDYDDADNREVKKKQYNTIYDIRYYVMYSDNTNNRGWYNVEEIREWLSGNKLLSDIVDPIKNRLN